MNQEIENSILIQNRLILWSFPTLKYIVLNFFIVLIVQHDMPAKIELCNQHFDFYKQLYIYIYIRRYQFFT